MPAVVAKSYKDILRAIERVYAVSRLSFGKPNLRSIDTTNQMQPSPNFEDQRLCEALNECRVETFIGHDAMHLKYLLLVIP